MTLGLFGCADYSYPKADPYESKQAIATSETDTKLFLSLKVQDVIAATNGLSQQLLIYQEDSVTPTKQSKNALLSSLQDVQQCIERNINYLNSFTPATSFKTKRDNIVGLLEDFNKHLDTIKKDINNDDFSTMKTHTQRYDSYIVQLQTISQ